MVKEFAWYLDDNRFSGLAIELDTAVRDYGAAKQESTDETALGDLRETARALFESHCIASGMRDEKAAYINIDAEFFDGTTLDEEALGKFIKNIVKNHCFQKVLWTYMGTTGSFTQISKSEMTQQGFAYENFLPVQHKKDHPAKPPLAEQFEDDNTVILYQYADGSVNSKYDPGKAKCRFNVLQDKSGVEWNKGYDPNDEVAKKGWRGAFSKDKIWRYYKDATDGGSAASGVPEQQLRIIKDGDSTILYDPGEALITPIEMLFFTDFGEPYGALELDRRETVDAVRTALKDMGIKTISAVGTSETPGAEKLQAYQAVLQEMAAANLVAVEHDVVLQKLHEEEKLQQAILREEEGLELEKTIGTAQKYSNTTAAIQEAVNSGMITVPLSLRNTQDAAVLGLDANEQEAVCAYQVRDKNRAAYNAALCNIYAMWGNFAGSGLTKTDVAKLVCDVLEGNETPIETVTFDLSLEDIFVGTAAMPEDNEAIDFYDTVAVAAFLARLEKRKTLPKGGRTSAESALAQLPDVGAEQRQIICRTMTRALSAYKEISMSCGMPIGELVATASAYAQKEDGPRVNQALKRKIYNEMPSAVFVKKMAKQNRQSKTVTIAEAALLTAPQLIFGGEYGKTLDEVLLANSSQKIPEFTPEERSFLHSVTLTETDAPVSWIAQLVALIFAARRKGKGTFTKNVQQILDNNFATGYNLFNAEGLKTYVQSRRFKESGLSAQTLNTMVQERIMTDFYGLSKQATPSMPYFTRQITPRFRDCGRIIPVNRKTPRGIPEHITRAIPGSEIGLSTSKPTASTAGSLPPIDEVPLFTGPVPTSGSVSTIDRARFSGQTGFPSGFLSNDFDAIVRAAPIPQDMPTPQDVHSAPNTAHRVFSRNVETEQLLHIDENYEEDKRALAQKDGEEVLARSATHDIGHAVGSEDAMPQPFKVGKHTVYDAFSHTDNKK